MEFNEVDVYCIFSFFGLISDGKLYVSVNNFFYIYDYLKKYVYQRWVLNCYFIMEEYIFICVINEGECKIVKFVS